MRRFVFLAVLLLWAAPVHAGLVLAHYDSFDGPDGSPWPAPWFAGGMHVTQWDLQGNRGRLGGDTPFVARMILPDFPLLDVEVSGTFEFENVAHQGIGFYVRQNGGTLQEYIPRGQGYAFFLKGNWAWPEDLGLWREIDGAETQFATAYDPVPGGLQDGVRYRVRYRVTQFDLTRTRLQARVWPEAGVEPIAWNVDVLDAEPMLQGVQGTYAMDIYNHSGTAHVFVDSLVITSWPTGGVPEGARGVLHLGAPRPNPTRDRAVMALELARNTPVDAALLDLAGRRVATLASGAWPAGAHTLDLAPALRGLAPGVYRVVANVGGERRERKLVLVR